MCAHHWVPTIRRATRRSVSIGAVLVVGLAGLTACGEGGIGGAGGGDQAGGDCDAAPNYPSGRPVELTVPWAAGGGTDGVARFIGTRLGERLDTQVNVVNQEGGGGVVGHSAISTGRPDGTEIGMITVELSMMHWQGLTDLTYEKFTPIGQVNADPAGITVRKNAPWNNAKQLLDDVRKKPGDLTASGTGRGGIWDLARAGLLNEQKLKPNAIRWVPSEGAAPALQELVAGGVDMSTSSLVENRTMLSEGRVKALAIMADERDPHFPDVPTLKEQGIDYSMSSWRGIAGPVGMDERVAEELGCHLEKIVKGKKYKKFMDKAGYGIVWKNADKFGKYLAADDKEKGELMKASGLAK